MKQIPILNYVKISQKNTADLLNTYLTGHSKQKALRQLCQNALPTCHLSKKGSTLQGEQILSFWSRPIADGASCAGKQTGKSQKLSPLSEIAEILPGVSSPFKKKVISFRFMGPVTYQNHDIYTCTTPNCIAADLESKLIDSCSNVVRELEGPPHEWWTAVKYIW